MIGVYIRPRFRNPQFQLAESAYKILNIDYAFF